MERLVQSLTKKKKERKNRSKRYVFMSCDFFFLIDNQCMGFIKLI